MGALEPGVVVVLFAVVVFVVSMLELVGVAGGVVEICWLPDF